MFYGQSCASWLKHCADEASRLAHLKCPMANGSALNRFRRHDSDPPSKWRSLRVELRGEPHEINFASMTQNALRSGRRRCIRRHYQDEGCNTQHPTACHLLAFTKSEQIVLARAIVPSQVMIAKTSKGIRYIGPHQAPRQC